MLTHFGQSIISQALSGHIGLQSCLFYNYYLSHFTSHIAAFGSKQLEWHFGGSQTGVQTASHLGSSHFHEHSGWHFWQIETVNKAANNRYFILKLL